MLTTTQQKSLILESARGRQQRFLNGRRSVFGKSSELEAIMGMQTVVGYVFGQDSGLYKKLDVIWNEIHETPVDALHG